MLFLNQNAATDAKLLPSSEYVCAVLYSIIIGLNSTFELLPAELPNALSMRSGAATRQILPAFTAKYCRARAARAHMWALDESDRWVCWVGASALGSSFERSFEKKNLAAGYVSCSVAGRAANGQKGPLPGGRPARGAW